jgi:hypothetical protein
LSPRAYHSARWIDSLQPGTTFSHLLARDLGFLDQSTHEMLSAEVVAVKRMLAAFIVKLRTRASATPGRQPKTDKSAHLQREE